MERSRVCALCLNEASVYCTSDSAFLCSGCDAKVHHANFLVARHPRQALCNKCKGFSGYFYSGAEIGYLLPVCGSCSGIEIISSEDPSASASSSSACISSSESISIAPTPTKTFLDDRWKPIIAVPNKNNVPGEKFSSNNVKISLESKARNVLENWCEKMGLENDCEPVVRVASEALSFCMGKLVVVPPLSLRLTVAASIWLGIRMRCSGKWTFQKLKRLEEISGVAAKMIVITERKLWFTLRGRRGRRELKEGWAECSAA